jgi:uncharacterized OB-fold protein
MSHPYFKKLDVQKTVVRSLDPQLVIEKPRGLAHIHTYGGETPFFKGLAKGKLLGTRCANPKCENSKLGEMLPPRVYCPDCLEPMTWVDVTDREAEIYTHITVLYPGAFNRLPTPCHLISVRLAGVSTTLMSYLIEAEPRIGLKVRPVFNTDSPTFTILDLAWQPA